MAKVQAPMAIISSAKPRAESERWGRSTVAKIGGSGASATVTLAALIGCKYRGAGGNREDWRGMGAKGRGEMKRARAGGKSRSRRMPAKDIAEAFRRFAVANPEPKGELHYTNPFTLLVAVVLSAQATDAGVNKATPALFALADTPERMVALGEDGVRDLIRTIGLFRTKARNIVALSRMLLAESGGKVPETREALQTLPGVGRKTANVVMNIAFGAPTIAVDTHIFRVANRTGMAPGRDPLAVEAELERVVPNAYRLHAHHWLILHGRYVCIARKPRCPACIVADLCRYGDKTPA
jgi:endonuclease-3